MKRAMLLALSVLFFMLLAAGCGARAKSGDPDSETHFLLCMTDAECMTGTICQCGQCMVQCASDTTCTASRPACLAGPTCATRRPVTVCATPCQTDGDCAAGLVCSGDVCSVKSTPAPADATTTAPASAATTQATPLSFISAQLAADGQDRLYVLGVRTVPPPPDRSVEYFRFLTRFEGDGSLRWQMEVDASRMAVSAAGEIVLVGNNSGYYNPPLLEPPLCPNLCAQHRSSAGELEWIKSGSFQEVVEADGGSFWLTDSDYLVKLDRSGNELFKQPFPFKMSVNGALKWAGPRLVQRGTLVWSEVYPPVADGHVEIVRPITGDLHRIAFPELANNFETRALLVAADGAVVIAAATTGRQTNALSCREMLGALRWTLPWTLPTTNPPLSKLRISSHRNGNLLVAGYSVGGWTFGASRVGGDPADRVGLVAEVDMSSGAVVWLHRLWAGPGDATWPWPSDTPWSGYPYFNPVIAPLVGLSDGRIAALVSTGSAPRLFLDDALVLDGLAPSVEAGALVIFKP